MVFVILRKDKYKYCTAEWRARRRNGCFVERRHCDECKHDEWHIMRTVIARAPHFRVIAAAICRRRQTDRPDFASSLEDLISVLRRWRRNKGWADSWEIRKSAVDPRRRHNCISCLLRLLRLEWWGRRNWRCKLGIDATQPSIKCLQRLRTGELNRRPRDPGLWILGFRLWQSSPVGARVRPRLGWAPTPRPAV